MRKERYLPTTILWCCSSLVAMGVWFLPVSVRADEEDPYKEFDSAFTDGAEPQNDAGAENEKASASQAPDSAANDERIENASSAPEKADELAVQVMADTGATGREKPMPLWQETFEMGGSLRNETAYRIRSHTQLSKVRNQAILTQSAALTENLQLKATERGYYDAVFDLTDHYPENVRDDMDHELEFRDTYLDYSAGDFDVRLGKQQIVWGESLGLFFADIVNAKDLREFVLQDFDLLRIPEWGVDVEYTRGDFHLELVYIPAPEMDKIGVEDSEYEFHLPVPEGIAFRQLGAEEPANSWENSEYGIRSSYLSDGWDVGMFYLYTWDKFPIYFRTFDPQTSELVLAPDFRRQHVVGATFSKEIAPVVLKGEFVVNPDASFSTSDPLDEDGVVRKTFIDYIFGVDFDILKTIDANVQFMQRAIVDHDDTLINNEEALRNLCSLWLSKSFLDGTVEPEFLVLASLTKLDLLIRPSLRYKFADHWDWKVGVDYFEGDSSELFGQFETGSRAYSELTYRF